MSDELLLPHRITLLGEAMRETWMKLESDLDRHIPVRETDFDEMEDMVDTVRDHLKKLRKLPRRIENHLERLMSRVVNNDVADLQTVDQEVSRFDGLLDDLIADYREVRSLDALVDDEEGRDLLADVYRHNLVEIRNWLGELVQTLADPLAAARKRGLPITGRVELPLVLNLTAAPELELLKVWLEGNTNSVVATAQPARDSGLGFWGIVGAVVLGWGISEALFGDDDCGCHGDL